MRGSPDGHTETTTGAVTVTVADAVLSVEPIELVARTQYVVEPTAPDEGVYVEATAPLIAVSEARDGPVYHW